MVGEVNLSVDELERITYFLFGVFVCLLFLFLKQGLNYVVEAIRRGVCG